MPNYDNTARTYAQGTGTKNQGNLTVTPYEAYSYQMRLAFKPMEGGYMVNMRDTSRTTNAHRYAIIRALENEGYEKAGEQRLPDGDTYAEYRLKKYGL